LRLVLDLRLAIRRSTPRRDHEAGTAFHDFLELVVRARALRVLVAELPRALQQIDLNLVEQRPETARETIHRDALLLARVTARDQNRRLLDVFGPDPDPQRDA